MHAGTRSRPRGGLRSQLDGRSGSQRDDANGDCIFDIKDVRRASVLLLSLPEEEFVEVHKSRRVGVGQSKLLVHERGERRHGVASAGSEEVAAQKEQRAHEHDEHDLRGAHFFFFSRDGATSGTLGHRGHRA